MSGVALDQLKHDFEMFKDQCRLLFQTRNTFDSLYSDEFVKELLYTSAKWFFDDLHRTLKDAYILQVARITDPAKTGTNSNLSAQYFSKQLETHGLSTDEITNLLVNINKYRRLTNKARSKLVAHNDLKSFRERTKLGAHEWEDMQDFLGDIVDFTDRVARQLGLPPEDYRAEAREGDVIDLIRLLKKARKQKETK